MIEQLAKIVGANVKGLREPTQGRRFSLDSYDFRLIQADRNTVYHVRQAESGFKWYLKLTREAISDPIEREELGLKTASNALAEPPSCKVPETWHADVVNAFVITSDVQAKTILNQVYRYLLSPISSKNSSLPRQFVCLGECVARLHDVQLSKTAPIQSRILTKMVASECLKAKHPDSLCEMVEVALEKFAEFPSSNQFSHGNLGLNNILASKGNLTIIDFECSGIGSPYDDLGLVCGTLHYLTSAVFISARRTERLIEAFISGYRDFSSIDPYILSQSIAFHVAKKYIYSFCNDRKPTVMGVPISKEKLASLTRNLLQQCHAI